MYRRYFKISLFIFAFILMATTAYPVEFQPIGFEALSMGGAGVASARGSYASYYNPALLVKHDHGTEVSLAGGIGIRELNVSKHIDTLSDIGIQESIDNIADPTHIAVPALNTVEDRNNITTIKDTLRSLSGKNGVQLMPTASLGVQMGNFGLGVYGISEATAYAVIDPQRLDLIVETIIPGVYVEYDEINNEYDPNVDVNDFNERSLQYALDNELTHLRLTGLAYTEIFFSHARTFQLFPGEFSIGASVKIMPGYTFDEKISIDTESGEIDNELTDREKRDTSWGIDLGVLYKPKKFEKLSMGLVFKNINTPKFDTFSGDTMEVKPQVRTGITYDLWKDRVTFALDADLTKNSTFLPGYKSQLIGGGINIHPFSWLCIRAGAMQNIQDSTDGTILTAGIGFGLKWLQLDVAGQMSTKTTEFDREEIPSYARAQISLVSKWL